MFRKSSDIDFLKTGEITIDADGIEVDLSLGINEKLTLMDERLALMDAKLAEMRAIRDEIQVAKLTAFDGALTKSGDGAAFNTGDIYMNVLTGEVFEK